MKQVEKLEGSLAKLFKDVPSLPKNAKDMIVEWAPWLALLGGLGSFYMAYWAWHVAHIVNRAADILNSYSQIYGGKDVVSNQMTTGLWLVLASAAVMGVIYLMAFTGLKEKKKAGWNLLFLGSLVNVVYGLVALLANYSYSGAGIGSFVGTLVGWYFLFQIRDSYTAKK